MLEEIKETLINSKPRAIFGVVVNDKGITIIGMGKSNQNERSHAVLGLRNLADKMEKELFYDFDKNFNKILNDG